MINEISISNFKSLKNVVVRFKRMSFFCGPNASGKTNFSEAVDFLSHVFRSGLQFAVAEKGGFYNMSLRRMRRSKSAISFGIAGTANLPKKAICDFQIQFSLSTFTEAIRSDFRVVSESYAFNFRGDDDNSSLLLTIERGENSFRAESTHPKHAYFMKHLGFEDLDALNGHFSSGFRPRNQQILFGPSPSFAWEFVLNSRNIAKELEGHPRFSNQSSQRA